MSPWLGMSTTARVDLVASYFHFAGTPYAESGAEGKEELGMRPGELFEEVESVVKARRKAEGRAQHDEL